MRPQLLDRARDKWDNEYQGSSGSQASQSSQMPSIHFAHRILEIKQDEECIIVGTLYKEMVLRPNILESYAKEVRSFFSFFSFPVCQLVRCSTNAALLHNHHPAVLREH